MLLAHFIATGLLLVAGACACSSSFAQVLSGSPPVTLLTPNVGAPPASVDIAQDDSSMLYIANAGGVLAFDGEIWQLIRLPNGDAASALMFDGHSRVYVGGYDLFGYLERDRTGQPVYHDLTKVFASQLAGRSFGGIYAIRVTHDGVFLEGTFDVFHYVPETNRGELWHFDGKFGDLDEVRGELWLQFRGEGIRRFHDGDWEPVAGTSGLSLLTNAFLPLPDGGVLSMTSDGVWREFVDGKVHEFSMPKGFPTASAINSAMLLRDGSFAMAAIDGGLWLYDPKTQRVQSMHISDGPVNALSLARDGGLLAVSDLSAFHVDWPGDWTSLTRHNGVSGTTHRLRSWGDRWYALSSSGVYRASPRAGDVAKFERLNLTDYDAYDMLVLDRNRALLAENFKLLLIDGAQTLHAIGRADLYPRVLVRSSSHPDQIYVGTEYGLAVLDSGAGNWSVRLDRGKTPERIMNLVELGNNQVLAGTTRQGVRLLTLDDARRRIVGDRQLGPAEGIRYGQIPHSAVSVLGDGSIIASTEAGLFRWTGTRFEPALLQGLDLPVGSAPVLTFASDGPEDWAFGGEHIYHHPRSGPWRAEEIGSIVSGYVESVAFEPGGVTLFGCANTILLYQKSAQGQSGRAPIVQLRSVEAIDAQGLETRIPLRPSEPLRVPEDFNIAFHFALPEFNALHPTAYQARLKGRDPSFSNWQGSNTYRYRHLPAGEYTFQVAARDRLGRISETEPFHFVVLEPWYATIWARILWVVLALVALTALVYVAISWRTFWLTRKRVELERVVTDRTRELVNANERLNELAHRDTLTGLANRALFERRLEQARASAQRHDTRFAVLFIDLDQFKTINDSLGHEAGDRLLKEVSARLSERLRREDTLARWGGDEFMVLAEDLHSTADVAVIAQTLLETASAPITLAAGAVAALSTSVGVSMYPDDATNINELIRNADTAMYSAKKRGGNQWCFYASEMTAIARERLEILNGLRLAAERGDFVLHYQPVVDVVSGQVMGAEALIRWEKIPGQLISPATFIAIAESTDLISNIGAWVIRTACREARHWLEADPEFTLAINISPRQLRNFELVRVVESALSEFRIDPCQLMLEVTESCIAEAGEDAQSIINELKSRRIRIAVDDFGTGQSALASLKRFDFDALKIDRSFIRDIPFDSDDREIAATIVAMGHTLGLTVIAEGVETEEQLEFLKGCGCDRFQGFLFGAGVSAAVLTEQLRSQRTEIPIAG
jgi:diguanylate cyclase (GGDEF)-like protein